MALVLALAGCPHHGGGAGGGGGTGPMPAAVSTLPVLRWVPADVTYAVVVRSATDFAHLATEASNVVGIAGDFDAADVSAESRRQLLFDLLSADSLRNIGVDVDASVAIWGAPWSPTFAARLGDAAALERFVDQVRDNGASLQSQIEDGIEVFTAHLDRDLAMQWAVADGWILAHVVIQGDHEPEMGWLAAARAAHGGLAGDPDFLAALDAARAHAGALADASGLPPMVGLVRPAALATSVEALMAPEVQAEAGRCLAPVHAMPRVLLSGGVVGTAAGGAIVADLDAAGGVAAAILPAPAGWYGARAGAAAQVDVGFDVAAAIQLAGGCGVDLRAAMAPGVRTIHVFTKEFDDGLPTVAGAYADLATDRTLRAMLDQIPGLDRFSKKRTLADTPVVDVDVPFVGSFTYHLSATRAIGAVGTGVIEAILGGGAAVDGELVHVALRPADVPVEAWDLVLGSLLDVARPAARHRTIDRLNRWQQGTIDARLVGSQVVIDLAGALRR